MTFDDWFLLGWAALILYTFGQIWLIQVVVYPLFARVGASEYTIYHRFYSSRIPLPVILPGFATFLAPIALLFVRPDAVSSWLVWANLACGLTGLVVTVALEIPRHARLVNGKDDAVIRELIRYNWLRTLSITGSAALTLVMLGQAFTPA